MIETKDGGSAFPLSGPLTTSDNLGMTLRDYFLWCSAIWVLDKTPLNKTNKSKTYAILH